ncbi:MAG TPA: hypothetical protein VGJ50_33610 [Streptosporangiaceae bacterium]
MTQVIVLNGGSSSRKSSIARAWQDVLPGMWRAVAVHAGAVYEVEVAPPTARLSRVLAG